MENIEKRLAAQLYRITCPPPDELGEYHLQMVTGSRAAAIKQHLNDCPHCRAELAQLQTYLAGLTPDIEHSLGERLQIWMARLIPSGMMGGGTMQPALAVRGQDDGPLMYEAGDAQLSLEVQDDPARPGKRTILGLLIGVDLEETAAHLWQDSEKAAQAAIDEFGNFVFAGLAPGAYELIIGGPDFEIHLQDLAV